MIKIPDSVKIGGLIYTVEETEFIKLGEGYIGEVRYWDLTIRLRPVSKAQMERAFIHELLHTIYDNLGYACGEKDEKWVDELAGALYALIVDNPGIFEIEKEGKSNGN